MPDALRILAPVRYPWTFNGPRVSRHRIERRSFAPLNRISNFVEGVTVLNPYPPASFDLVHAFNRIPIGRTPFVIGFESHMPRVINREDTWMFRAQTRMLRSNRCRAILPISRMAEHWFRAFHGESAYWDELAPKLRRRYPNVPVYEGPDAAESFEPGPIRMTFVGSHFGRKGGCVAVKIAEKALARGIDLRVTIVSDLQCGNGIWTDPLRPGFFDDYLKLTELPNVRHESRLPNDEVLGLLRDSHFCLLPTFSDTFGFSAVEAMMVYTPVIGTTQGALPEFISHRDNGILLQLPTTEFGAWTESHYGDRASPAFEARFRDEVDRLAEEALAEAVDILGRPADYRTMRRSAHATAVRMFGHVEAARFWDDLYKRIVAGEPVTRLEAAT